MLSILSARAHFCDCGTRCDGTMHVDAHVSDPMRCRKDTFTASPPAGRAQANCLLGPKGRRGAPSTGTPSTDMGA